MFGYGLGIVLVIMLGKREEHAIEYLEKGVEEKVIDQRHAKDHKWDQHEDKLVRCGIFEAYFADCKEMDNGTHSTHYSH